MFLVPNYFFSNCLTWRPRGERRVFFLDFSLGQTQSRGFCSIRVKQYNRESFPLILRHRWVNHFMSQCGVINRNANLSPLLNKNNSNKSVPFMVAYEKLVQLDFGPSMICLIWVMTVIYVQVLHVYQQLNLTPARSWVAPTSKAASNAVQITPTASSKAMSGRRADQGQHSSLLPHWYRQSQARARKKEVPKQSFIG